MNRFIHHVLLRLFNGHYCLICCRSRVSIYLFEFRFWTTCKSFTIQCVCSRYVSRIYRAWHRPPNGKKSCKIWKKNIEKNLWTIIIQCGSEKISKEEKTTRYKDSTNPPHEFVCSPEVKDQNGRATCGAARRSPCEKSDDGKAKWKKALEEMTTEMD